MDQRFYNSTAWRRLRQQALQRDNHRCTVSRLLGGECRGTLHVHHIDPAGDPLDLDGTATTCAVHHPQWEALRRHLVSRRRRTCPHRHRYRWAREACERRINAAA